MNYAREQVTHTRSICRCKPTLLEVLRLRPGVNGEMMVTMLMELVNTGALRPRVEAVDMLGRATVRQRGRFWVLPVVLSRGHLARDIGSGVVSAVIVVVEAVEVAGTVHDNLLRPLLSSRRPLAGLPRSWCCLVRLWR